MFQRIDDLNNSHGISLVNIIVDFESHSIPVFFSGRPALKAAMHI